MGDANQLGRRNLSPDQYSLLRGRRYNRTKKQHGGERESSAQNEHLPKTAEALATRHGVSRETIKRDGQFAAAVGVSPRMVEAASKVIDSGVPDLVKAVEGGEIKVSAAAEKGTC